MESILPFYANLLRKLSLTQSILITTFTSWIQCLWGGVSCQHIPPSVSGSSGRLFAACWEKLLPLLPLCSVSNPPLSLVSFHTALLLRFPQRKNYCYWGHSFRWTLKCRRNILWVKTESLFLKYVSTAKARCSTDQRSMATEMLWASLEARSRKNSPRQRFHSEMFCQIVRYFCRTL